MNLFDVQTELAARALYTARVDGMFGTKTDQAIEAFLLNQRVKDFDRWGNDRQVVAAKQAIARERGIEVGDIDGRVGPQTRHAIEVYDARKENGWKPVPEVEQWRGATDETMPAVMPSHALPPAPIKGAPPRLAVPKQSQVSSFYGAVGANQETMTLPFPMRLAWDTEQVVRKTSCHAKVREQFEFIWKSTLDYYGTHEIHRLRLDMFGGCLNVRKMRGGSSWSMHSWGIAWDVDPDRNQLKFTRDQATLDGPEYDPYWGFVYATGACGLGRERNYDWMHLQLARI